MSLHSETQRLTGVRKIIADRMMASLASTAQLTFHAQADISNLLAERRRLQQHGGAAPSLEDCSILAFAEALSTFPDMNGTTDGDSVTLSQVVNIAVALSIDGRLFTPVICDAGTLDLQALANTRQAMVARARKGETKVSEMKGGTATISNLGRSAVRYFTPILNSGQLTLLGVGGTWQEAVFGEDMIVVARRFLGLSLTVDHRVIDGEAASRFLTAIVERLERFQLAQQT